MRAVTKVTIREELNGCTVFMSYNNNDNDYSVDIYENIEKSLEAVRKLKTDSYFPLRTDFYIHQTIKGGELVCINVSI